MNVRQASLKPARRRLTVERSQQKVEPDQLVIAPLQVGQLVLDDVYWKAQWPAGAHAAGFPLRNER